MKKRVVVLAFLVLSLVLGPIALTYAFSDFSEIYSNEYGELAYGEKIDSQLSNLNLPYHLTNTVSVYDKNTESNFQFTGTSIEKPLYIIELKRPPLIKKEQSGFSASSDTDYKERLKQEHKEALADIQKRVAEEELPNLNFIQTIVEFFKSLLGITGRAVTQTEIVPEREYYNVFNGISLKLDMEQAKKVQESPYIKKVYPNYIAKINLMDSIPLIGAPEIWDSGYDGQGIKLGIVDTGIDYTHPDLGGCFGDGCKVEGGYDFVEEDDTPMDDNGHGTHCAGIAAGDGAGEIIVYNITSYWKLDGNANDLISNNNGIVSGAVSTEGKYGQAYKFDGIDDYIAMQTYDDLDNLHQGTISAWINSSSNEFEAIFAYSSKSETSSNFVFRVNNGTLEYSWNPLGSTSWAVINSSTNINDGKWHHVALVSDGNTRAKIYLDGAEEQTSFRYTGSGSKGSESDWIADINDISSNGHHISIGALDRSTATNFFKGAIDEVKIWNYALNKTEIIADNLSTSLGEGSTVESEGLNGVAPKAKLYAYKVCNSGGSCEWDDILAALERATDPNQDGDTSDHLDIVSLSLGGSGNPDDAISKAVDNAVDLGIVAVIAAGNNGYSYYAGRGTIGSPGTARKAITVGATYKKDYEAGTHNDPEPLVDTVTSFSSRGPVYWENETIKYLMKPDIVAPGAIICSARYDSIDLTAHNPLYTTCLDEKHIQMSGTSMATPMVAGAAALIKQAHPGWSPEKIKYSLMATARDIGESPESQGRGRLNLSIESYANIVKLSEIEMKMPFQIKAKIDVLNFKNLSLYIDENIVLETSAVPPPTEGIFATYDLGKLNDGLHYITLEVRDSSNKRYYDKSMFYLEKIEFQQPSKDSVLNNKEVHDIQIINKVPGLVFNNIELEVVNQTPGYTEEVYTKGITKISDYQWKWDASLYEQGSYKLRVKTNYSGYRDQMETDVFLDKNLKVGWPKPLIDTSGMWGSFRMALSLMNQPTIYDLNNDGKKEIIIAYGENIEVEDENAKVYAFQEDGSQLAGFPVVLPVNTVQSGPVAGDFDKDGYGEIYGIAMNPNYDRVLYKVQHNGNYEVSEEEFTSDRLFSFDINDDGYSEFYGISFDGDLYLMRDNLKKYNNNWPMDISNYVTPRTGSMKNGTEEEIMMETPFLIDYNREGIKELLLQGAKGYWTEIGGGWYQFVPQNSTFYAFDLNAQLVSGFPKELNYALSCINQANLSGEEKIICVSQRVNEEKANWTIYLLSESLEIEKQFEYELNNSNKSSYDFYSLSVGQIDGKTRITLSGRELTKGDPYWYPVGSAILLVDIETGKMQLLNDTRRVWNSGLYSIGKVSNSPNTEFNAGYYMGIYDENENWLQGGATAYFRDIPGNVYKTYMNDIELNDGEIVSDVEGDGYNDIIAVTWDGQVYLWSSKGSGMEEEWNECLYNSKHTNCYKCAEPPGLHEYNDIGVYFDMNYTYIIGEDQIKAVIANNEKTPVENIQYTLEIGTCEYFEEEVCNYNVIEQGTIGRLEINGEAVIKKNYTALENRKEYKIRMTASYPGDENPGNNVAIQSIYAKTPGPDLSVHGYHPETSVIAGEPKKIEFGVYNQGTVTSEGSSVTVYQAQGYCYSQEECAFSLLGEVDIGNVGPYENIYRNITFTASSKGGHTLLFVVNSTQDTNLENNVDYLAFEVKEPGPDLSVYGYYPSPSVIVGEAREMEFEVYNYGTNVSEGGSVTVYRAQGYCYSQEECGFSLLGQKNMGPIEPYERATYNITFTASAKGYHTLLFVVNTTIDTDLGNNVDYLAFEVKEPGPDPGIYISYWENQRDFIFNKSNKITFEIENYGTEKATNITASLYEIETTHKPEYIETRRLIDEVYIGDVENGERTIKNFTWTPNRTGEFNFYVNISSDWDVYEENNEQYTSLTAVKNETDINLTGIYTSSSIIAGKESYCYVYGKNLGTGIETINLSFYDNGGLIEKKALNSIYAGDYLSITFHWQPPTKGLHRLKFVAEVPGDINPANNLIEKDVFVYELTNVTFKVKNSTGTDQLRHIFSEQFYGLDDDMGWDNFKVNGERKFEVPDLSVNNGVLEFYIMNLFSQETSYDIYGVATLFNVSFNKTIEIASDFYNKTTEDNSSYYLVFANKVPLQQQYSALYFNPQDGYLSQIGIVNYEDYYPVYCTAYDFANKKCNNYWEIPEIIDKSSYYNSIEGETDESIQAIALSDKIDFDCGTTNLSAQTSDVISNFTIERCPYGRIRFKEDVDISYFKVYPSIIGQYFRIKDKIISVNVEKLTMLANKPAELLFRNIDMRNPRILYNGQSCNSSICSNKVYDSSSKTLKVDISKFSSFEIIEGPYCGDGACQADEGESCSSCSADCSCGGTGGGGESGGGKVTCKANWNCIWTPCTNNLQTYNCVDKNRCGTLIGRPSDNGNTKPCLINRDCVDNDKDGYGIGKDCLGPDINDNDPGITDTTTSNPIENPDTTADKINKFLKNNWLYIIIILASLCLLVILAIILIKVFRKPSNKTALSPKKIEELKEKSRKFE